jgi:hypothetical protein
MEENLKTYALIVEGKVANVSLWADKPSSEFDGELVEVPANSTAGIGWDYVDGVFEDNRPPVIIED